MRILPPHVLRPFLARIRKARDHHRGRVARPPPAPPLPRNEPRRPELLSLELENHRWLFDLGILLCQWQEMEMQASVKIAGGGESLASPEFVFGSMPAHQFNHHPLLNFLPACALQTSCPLKMISTSSQQASPAATFRYETVECS